MPLTHLSTVVVSIPAPRDQQDGVVLVTVAPVLRALRASPALDAAWFGRVNKPIWALRVLVTGEAGWLANEARATLATEMGVATGTATFVEDDPDDKWTGGLEEREGLKTFHHHDSWACLEALEADVAGNLGSRSRFSMLVVERLLDVLDLREDARLDFYRGSFQWAIEMGRWDAEVFEALERTFARQREALALVIDSPDDGSGPGPWPAPEAARIGRALVAALPGSFEFNVGDASRLATFAAHAHSNRLGLHASREAALRYLVWRARGGSRT